jgi:hypothetical protein
VTNWFELNQRALNLHLARVRAALLKHATRESGEDDAARNDKLASIVAAMHPARPALDVLGAAFDLSPFERDVVVLCAGVELDSSFASLCAQAQGDPQKSFPTFGLALAALPEAHWSALTPDAPLRHWRLIEIGAGGALTASPMRIDERVLNFLVGASHLDDRLAGLVERVEQVDELVPSQNALVDRIVRAWSNLSGSAAPIVQLLGEDATSARAIAAAACAELNLRLAALDARVLPTEARELDALRRLWEREAVLNGSALLLDALDLDDADAARGAALLSFLERTRSALFCVSHARRRALTRAALALDVQKPSADEQRVLWQHALGAAAPQLNGKLETLVAQFNLDAPTIRAASANALQDSRDDSLADALWEQCRVYARPRLESLAQRIEPAATWDDIVLPDAQLAILRDIAAHVRQRHTVYETWGWANKSARGLGISALFAGTSGTGKTMAAEVLANELRLDLYRIDLSAVVSKYIGETEKNLRRVFDAAEEGGALLVFDEADALFGKRSEVKDSHDRYANIEVSYLLQRMEAYRGLAILTTNLQEALDKAFLRRLRFIVQFPFPDFAQRVEIWRRVFPPQTPTEGLDHSRLARLNIAGGNIRNIALHASFLAADQGKCVRMAHLLSATRSEYAKMDKPLTEIEIRDWK